VDEESERGEWTRRVNEESGRGEWRRRVEEESGGGEWRRKKGHKPVHNKIHPQKLNGGQGTLAVAASEGSDERDCNGYDVNCELELNELANCVKNVTSPQRGFHDRGKVIIEQHHICKHVLSNIEERGRE
jgi:hypothetical protein